jgi:site-specific recombinase XerC
LLAAPDQRTWSGRRDHAFILLAVQTGLRLSEMTGLKREDIILGTGAHVRLIGKGRKERCTPIASLTSRPLFFFSLGFVLFWTAFVASNCLFIWRFMLVNKMM